jgi:hypothetical protein
MIVENAGYLKMEQVLEMATNKEIFAIYLTHKGTHILIKDLDCNLQEHTVLYLPKKDRLPWKLTEGKRIVSGTRVFKSTIDDINNLDTSKWNNKNQIMSYKQFSFNY